MTRSMHGNLLIQSEPPTAGYGAGFRQAEAATAPSALMVIGLHCRNSCNRSWATSHDSTAGYGAGFRPEAEAATAPSALMVIGLHCRNSCNRSWATSHEFARGRRTPGKKRRGKKLPMASSI